MRKMATLLFNGTATLAAVVVFQLTGCGGDDNKAGLTDSGSSLDQSGDTGAIDSLEPDSTPLDSNPGDFAMPDTVQDTGTNQEVVPMDTAQPDVSEDTTVDTGPDLLDVAEQVSQPDVLVDIGPSDTTTGDGACNNLDDLGKMASLDIASVSQSCVTSCIMSSDPACSADCVENKTGLSPGCSACFGALLDCTKKNCLMACMGGAGEACDTCIADKCLGAFEECAGVEKP